MFAFYQVSTSAFEFTRNLTNRDIKKHLRWAHRFLRMHDRRDTPSFRQTLRGMRRKAHPRRTKMALTTASVTKLVKKADADGNHEVAAIMAVSRLFLLRVPSEALPLQWAGEHSSIDFDSQSVKITLMRRKNVRHPTTLTRSCCCKTSGKRLCAFHRLLAWKQSASEQSTQVFSLSKQQFIATVRELAMEVGIEHANKVGTHAFRRGMAQDILDVGGSLAVLMRAGDWRSSAFLTYLRDSQPQEKAVSQMVFELSDSEAD